MKPTTLVAWANDGQNRTVNCMKGIGMLLVVMGHFYPNAYISSFIRSFHMPLFFILSGYFFRKQETRASLQNNYKRLMRPYFACALLCVGLLYLTGLKGYSFLDVVFPYIYMNSGNHGTMLFLSMPKMFGLWFLPALFWCRISYNGLMNSKLKWGGVIAVSVFATIIDHYVTSLPFCILPGLSAMMFYMIGHAYKDYKDDKVVKAIITACVICWPLAMIFSKLRMVECYYEHYPLDIAGACGGVFFTYLISRLALRMAVLSDILVWVGRLSLCFYCVHCIDFTIFPEYLVEGVHWTVVYCMKMIVYSLLVYLLCNIRGFRNLFGIKFNL